MRLFRKLLVAVALMIGVGLANQAPAAADHEYWCVGLTGVAGGCFYGDSNNPWICDLAQCWAPGVVITPAQCIVNGLNNQPCYTH